MAANPVLAPAIFPMFQRKYAGFEAIQSNGVATCRVPTTGRHYAHRLHFKTSAGANLTQAEIESQVTLIKVKINGVTTHEAPPAVFHMLQKYYGDAKGATIVPGVLLIDYCRRHLTLPAERKQMALGMQGVDTFTIECYTGTLSNLAVIDFNASIENVESPLGPHYRLLSNPQYKNTTGEHQISDLPKAPNAALLAYHISLGSVPGVLSEVSLIADNVNLFERQAPTVTQQVLEDAGRNPQSGYYHIDFNLNNEVLGLFPWTQNKRTVQDWRLTPNWSTAPNDFKVYTEQVFNMPQL
ncbi:MAG: major capsid protein P2 [Vampirovibrionales bacterium]|nr:major capsid protein P2 [Vampirovibrionales bacterium]